MQNIILIILRDSLVVLDNLFLIILISFLGLIIYLIVINIHTLRRVIRLKASDKKRKISDVRYHELDNKIQLLIVVSSIIILIGGFIGYNSITSIQNEITDEISVELMEYRAKLEKYDSTIIHYDQIIEEMAAEKDSVLNLSRNLRKLQNEYKLNAKSYFIKGIEIDPNSKNSAPVKIYFNKIRTANGNELPLFNKAPFLSILGKGEGWVIIENITNQYFEYYVMTTIDFNVAMGKKPEKPNLKEINSFDLIIIDILNNK